MPELHLILADKALRAAIAEQLALAALEGVRLCESAHLSLPLSAETVALIIDASPTDRKTLKPLCGRLRIFALDAVEPDDDLAVECFPKPLRLGHLLARVQLHLQALRVQPTPLVFGSFRLEAAARQIVIEETETVIRLTEKETQLLEYLGRSKNPVAREELLAAIWGYDARIDTHTLETHIYRLRRKLDPEGSGMDSIVAAQGAYFLAAVRP